MIRTDGLTHIHLLVRNLERSLRFYKDAFGLEERFRDGPSMVFLRTPGARDTVTLNEVPFGPREVDGQQPSSADAARLGSTRTELRVDHFGFRLAPDVELDDAIAEVERSGGKLIRRGKHPSGDEFAYVADPDGYVIEL